MLSEPAPAEHDAQLAKAREQIEQPGRVPLLLEEGGELRTVALTREWTRIGRSLAADVRFDDPTVSRRHALIVRQPDGVRVLDDRSLNGVFVNGARVDGKALQDGDEIIVGRYRLSFLSVAAPRRRGRRSAGPPSRAQRSSNRGLSAAPRASRARRVVSRSMAHTIAVLSQKGGTGKTTAVRTLTDVLRRSGVRTLAVDLDPQGNLSDYFDLPPDVRADDRRRALRALERRRGDPRGHDPGQPHPRRGRADAGRQDGPRADAASARWPTSPRTTT